MWRLPGAGLATLKSDKVPLVGCDSVARSADPQPIERFGRSLAMTSDAA
jgi:hypothetical protein